MKNELTKFKREGAIAFLDILGFKGIWTKMPPEQIIKIIKGIIAELLKSTKIVSNEKKHYGNLDVTVISDTIIIEFMGETYKTTIFIAEVIQRIFFPFLAKKLPIRGAVTFGTYYRSGNIYVGPAIDDVAEWYNKANWMGVILTPSATMSLEAGYCDINFETLQKTLNKFWIKYPIPLKKFLNKKNNITLYALNWPNHLIFVKKGLEKSSPKIKNKSSFSIILQILSEQGNVGPSICDKYDNTICFVRKCLEIDDD